VNISTQGTYAAKSPTIDNFPEGLPLGVLDFRPAPKPNHPGQWNILGNPQMIGGGPYVQERIVELPLKKPVFLYVTGQEPRSYSHRGRCGQTNTEWVSSLEGGGRDPTEGRKNET